MVCGTCRHDNQPNAKFCSECGAPLPRSCPSCGTEQPSTAKFCDECGTSLAAASATTPAQVPTAARKRVTALFADLVGSTAFAERLDPEAVRAGLAPYFELLQSTIDEHDGTVVKFLGDGLFALFGVPEVAEDDALRAVAAGLDLQGRFRTFATDLRDQHGVELGLRVGVNTGELVVGTDDIELVGDVINTAKRLEAACEPGRVLVGEDTWRLTRTNVPYEVLGEVRVKGKTAPVATFQVIDHEVSVAEQATPFVGRTEELDVLRAVFDAATAGSTARLATVIGEPGVGKTRLAQELRAGSEARSFDLRLERRGSTTFSPIADLLRDVTGSGSPDGIDRLVEGHPEAGRLAPVLASFLGHGEVRTTEESFWAIRRLLELLAADGPVIVVVDDVQWAEPLFWDLLDHLVEWTTAPVLLLVLARPELRELRPELTRTGRRVSAAIALEGLDADTTLELAARLLGIDELPTELADRLPSSTEGNPLFVRELVQMLVDDGVLARDGDRWRLTIDADAIEVPPTILSLLASRVERLPDDERQVIELASVIGTEFDRGTLTAIATPDVGTRLGAVIDRLRRKDLIEPSGQWTGDHPVYRFHHVLIRDAAYRRLLKGHRAELHERVGRHVETAGTDDARDVLVAHHFEQVIRYRSELGAVDDRTRGLAVEAATRLRAAAEQALGREDLASAGSAAIRALALLDADAGADRDELLLIGCEALLSSADVARSAPLVDELHQRSSDARLAAWADCFRAQQWSLTDPDRLTEASELAADAAERLAVIGDDAGVATARLVRAGCLARLGRVGDCEAELDLALGAARAAGDRRRTVAVLGAAPLAALWGPSPVARAGGRCLDVLRLLRITSASPTVETASIRCQGMLEALRGRGEAARAKFETSRATARELGLRHALYETELFAGLAELLAGDAVAAEPHLRAARDGLGRLGIGADAGQAAALLARSLLLQGRLEEADELASGALETAGQNLQTAIASRAVLAEIRATQGRHPDARALVDEAISIVAPTDVTLDHALTLLAAARVAGAAGDTESLRRFEARAAELLAAKGVTLRLEATATSQPIDRSSRTVATSTADAEPVGPGTDPGFDTDPGGRRIWNRALELAHRSTLRAIAGDRDGVLACHAPDFTTVDHGAAASAAGFDGRSGAASWADFAIWVMAQNEGSTSEPVPIAVRGEDHALMRWTLRSPAATLQRLVVLASDGTVLRSAHFYDPDQLLDAMEELDRQWYEHRPLEHVGSDEGAASTARPHELARRSDQQRAFTNTAWELGLLADAAFRRRDRAAMLRLLSPGFVGTWHERLAEGGLVEVDRDRFVETVLAVGHADMVDRTTELLATRGDRLALVRATTVFEAASEGRYVVLESDETQLTRSEHFDEDQLDEAIDELDRRWVATCGVPSDSVVVRAWPMTRSTRAGDVAAFVHPEFEYTDHCRLRTAQHGGDLAEFVRRGSVEPETWSLVTNVHRFDQLGAVYERVEFNDGNEIWLVWVAQQVDGAMRRLDRFDHEDLDTAIALFDSRRPTDDPHRRRSPPSTVSARDNEGGRHYRSTADRTSPNRAYRLADEFGRATIRGDRDAMLEILDDDFTSVWRSATRIALGLSTAMTRLETVDDLLTVYRDERIASQARAVVATRGDHRYLSTSTITSVDGDEVLIAVVGETDDTRLRSLTYYDESQLGEALHELDRRYRIACGIDDDHWIATNWDALTSFDADRWEAFLDADFRSVDHRTVALGVVGRAEFLEWLRATPPAVSWSIPAIHRLGDRGMVVEHVESWADGTGDTRMLLVAEFGDRRTVRVDAYEPEALDTALARYDEITGASRRQLTNRAWESARRRQDAQARQDRAGFAAMFDAQFVAEFHDPLMTGTIGTASFDKPGFMELVLHPDMTSRGAGSEMELLAIRGDDLCLYRVGMISPDGDLTERLVVDATHEGRCLRMDVFDPGQLIDAQLELDRWYRRACGLGDVRWMAEEGAAALYATDFASLEPFLHPDFEYVERRPLSYFNGDAVELAHAFEALEAFPIEFVSIVPVVHRLSEHGMVSGRLERYLDGSTSEQVHVAHIEDERLRRLIAYAPDDLGRALAEFDEYVARRSTPTLTNRAWEAVQEAQLVRLRGDRDRFASFFAEDFVVTSHDPIMGLITGGTYDKALWLEAAFDPSVFGPTSQQDIELIAVRGDDHSLFRSRATTRSGDLHERVNVMELRDGLAVRMDVFPHDQLRDAQIALDRRWLASLGFAEDHPWVELVGRYYDADSTVIAQALSDRFRYLDHRKLSWPDGDRSQLLSNQETLIEAAEVVIPRYLRVTDRLAIGERIEQTVGGANQSGGLHVTALGADGRIEYMEIFEVDDEAGAIACFDRLLAETEVMASPGPAIPPLTNRAWEITAEVSEAFLCGDREALERLIDPKGVVESRYRFGIGGSGTGQGFVDLTLASYAETREYRHQFELIAVRDDHLCLVMIDGWYDDDNLRNCLVVETDDERVTHMVWFDDDQLVDAQLELDRRWQASSGFGAE